MRQGGTKIMSQNKKITTVIVVLCVIVVFVVVGFNSKMHLKTDSKDSYLEERNISEILTADSYEKVDIEEQKTDFDEINAIYKGMDKNGKVIGYAAFLTIQGYGGPMNVNVATDEKGEKILALRVGDNHEDYGKLVETEEFYKQFDQAPVPLHLVSQTEEGKSNQLEDGTYHAEAEKAKEGYKTEVVLTVKEGKIEEVKWDEKNEKGESKKSESLKGNFVLEGEDLKWHEQVEKIEKLMKEKQDPSKISIDAEGKTDIPSVTIRVDEFLHLVRDCIDQARGQGETTIKNNIDGISGATISSTAVVNAANIAAEFISSNLNK